MSKYPAVGELKEAATPELKVKVGSRAKDWLEWMEGSQEEVAVCLLSKEWGYLPSPTVTPNWGTREEREEKSNFSLLSKPLDFIPGDSTAFPEDGPVLGHPAPTPDQRT